MESLRSRIKGVLQSLVDSTWTVALCIFNRYSLIIDGIISDELSVNCARHVCLIILINMDGCIREHLTK